MILSTQRDSAEIDELEWDRFVSESPQAIIYARYGYLRAVYGQWSAIITEEDGIWIAVLPFAIRRKYLFVYSFTPPFTQYLGLLFAKSSLNGRKEIEWKRKVMQSTIDILPGELKLFNHNFGPICNYLGPFYWSGFRVQAFQSFVLHLPDAIHDVYSLFSSGIRESISKANRRGHTTNESDDIAPLIVLLKKNGLLKPEQERVLENLWSYLSQSNQGFVLYVKDSHGKEVSGGLFLIDRNKVIFLSTATDPASRSSGVHPQLVWEGIKKAGNLDGIRLFDFEGSMIKGVDNYFNNFGAEPIFYFNVSMNRLSVITRILLSTFKRRPVY
jgi:Acetyltransferase (GNAT) domain